MTRLLAANMSWTCHHHTHSPHDPSTCTKHERDVSSHMHDHPRPPQPVRSQQTRVGRVIAHSWSPQPIRSHHTRVGHVLTYSQPPMAPTTCLLAQKRELDTSSPIHSPNDP